MSGKKWFIIEGNIGSGKTTLINKLKSNNDYEVIEEPVSTWLSIKGDNDKNLLGLFMMIQIDIHIYFKQWYLKLDYNH